MNTPSEGMETLRQYFQICLVVLLVGLPAGIARAQNPPLAPLSTTPEPMPSLNPTSPTLFIVGDSTVKNSGKELGWGTPIATHFDQTRINVVNRARGGRSSRTFQTEGLWDQVLAASKPGDFVLIQMGHNDGGPINDASRARGSLPGVGEETQEIDNRLTQKHEVVHTYGWYMRKYVTDARAKGMTPIVLSPVPHCPKTAVTPGSVEKSRYVIWASDVARSENALFIDLNRIVMSHYVGKTPEEIKAEYFTPADNTHSSPAGANLNADSVVEGLRTLKNCPLTQYLRDTPAVAPTVDRTH